MKNAGEYIEIPISAARQIAETYSKNQVIIVTWDDTNQMVHVTTYGTTQPFSAQAAQGGNFVKEALGWPDRLCHDTPSWWQEGVEEIGKLADTADNLLATTKLPVSDRIHLEGLKEGLGGIFAKLKDIYVALSGNDPWERHHNNDEVESE